MSDADTDPLRRLVRGGSLYTAASVLQLGAAFAVVPVITRLLPPEEYGAATAALVILQFLAILGTGGLQSAIMHEYFRSEDGPQNVRLLVTLIGGAGLVVTIAAYLTGPLWEGALGELEFSPVLQLSVVAVLPSVVTSATQVVLRAQERPVAFILVTSVRAVGSQAVGLLAIVWIHATASTYVGGVLVATIVSALLGGSLVVPARLHRTGIKEVGARAIRVGAPALPHTVATFAMAAGDRLVIERLISLSAVGRYHVAYAIGSLGLVVLRALNSAWQPIVIGAAAADVAETVSRTHRAVVNAAGTSAAVLALLSPIALRIAAPASYDIEPLADVVAVVALVAVPYAVYAPSLMIMVRDGRTSPLAWIAPVTANISLLGAAIIGSMVGLLGVALASLLAYWLQAALLVTRAGGSVRGVLKTARLAFAIVAIGLGAHLSLASDGRGLAGRAVLAALLTAVAVGCVVRDLRDVRDVASA